MRRYPQVGLDGFEPVVRPVGSVYHGGEISPDGSKLAATCTDGTTGEFGICTLSSGTGDLTWIAASAPDGSGSWDSPTWSPHGSRLAAFKHDFIANTSNLYVIGANGSNPVQVPVPTVSQNQNAKWFPDGRIGYVACSSDCSTMSIVFVPNPTSSDGNQAGVVDNLQPSGTPSKSFTTTQVIG